MRVIFEHAYHRIPHILTLAGGRWILYQFFKNQGIGQEMFAHLEIVTFLDSPGVAELLSESRKLISTSKLRRSEVHNDSLLPGIFLMISKKTTSTVVDDCVQS